MSRMKIQKQKASAKELIHDKLKMWNYNIIHDIDSQRFNKDDAFNSVTQLLNSKDRTRAITCDLSVDQINTLIQDIYNKTDYRIDVKSYTEDDFNNIKEVVNVPYEIYESNDAKTIELKGRVGLWKEYVHGQGYIIVINTGYTTKPIIVIYTK